MVRPGKSEPLGTPYDEQIKISKQLGLGSKELKEILRARSIFCRDCQKQVMKTGRHQIRCPTCAKKRIQALKRASSRWSMRERRHWPKLVEAIIRMAYAPEWFGQQTEIERQIDLEARQESWKPGEKDDRKRFRRYMHIREEMLDAYRKEHGPLPLDPDYWPDYLPPKNQLAKIFPMRKQKSKTV